MGYDYVESVVVVKYISMTKCSTGLGAMASGILTEPVKNTV